VVPFRTAEAAVAGELRRAILAGDLAPGARLLQADLAEYLQMSITPIRSALKELSAEGLIRIEPHRSVVVHDPSEDELREVHHLRLLLEPSCMAKTAELITEAQLADAEAILDAMDAELDPRPWSVLNRDFHACLVQASCSPRLAATLVNLLSLSALHIRKALPNNRVRMRGAAAEHRAMLVACKARDRVGARSATSKHLMSSNRALPIARRASD
jgi:DNA-binding GntR family transcriptional regulator